LTELTRAHGPTRDAGSSEVNATPPERFQRAAEAHDRYHARHRHEAFVGTREPASLDEPARPAVIEQRDAYERGFRDLIERGRTAGDFLVRPSRLAAYAIEDMGIGVVWFRDEGSLNEDEVVRHYGSTALPIVGADR
jgi:hypothetical protein